MYTTIVIVASYVGLFVIHLVGTPYAFLDALPYLVISGSLILGRGKH